MAGRRRRESRVRDILGGRLFGGPRRTAREFVTIVALVFGMVAVLVLQTWQRVEMIETMRMNKQLTEDFRGLRDLVVCRETALEQDLSRLRIVSRAESGLDLRVPEWEDVVFVTGGRSRNPTQPECRKSDGGQSL